MRSDVEMSEGGIEPDDVSARELARVVRRASQLFGSFQLGNLTTSEALAHLADHLEFLGSTPIRKLRVRSKPKRKSGKGLRSERLRDLSLAEVEELLENTSLTKTDLAHLARQRFGVPEAQLKRMPLDEVRDEVKAALGHERSLEYIEKNAEISGRSRQS